MYRSFKLISIALIIFLLFGCATDVEIVKSGKYTYKIAKNEPLNARIYTLDNGLKVYLSVYKDAPRIYTAIAIQTGSKKDPASLTGMAHYLEHLLFKGTDEFGTSDWEKEKVEIDKITVRGIEFFYQFGDFLLFYLLEIIL